MIPEAKQIWSALEFRMPMLLRQVESLSGAQMLWVPGPGRVSIAWQLWHIAEVEDVWVRDLVLGEELEFPFGIQVREAARDDQYPTKSELLSYLQDVRAMTKKRLESATSEEFDRVVEDRDFGTIAVRDVWSGVITSFAWHAGQIALTAKLLPDSPIEVMAFGYWKRK